MEDMKSFWDGFKKQANASGAMYMRDLAVDTGIHSMQEDMYPENSYSFFDPDKSVYDALDVSVVDNNRKPDTLTLGYAEPG